MSAETKTLSKIKSTKQKIPTKPPHGGGITRKVSQASQAYAAVEKPTPSQPRLPKIMSIRRISIQSHSHSLTAGIPISKVGLIKPVPVKIKRHLPKIEPQKAGVKHERKILHKVFIQQCEPVKTSYLPKMTLLKAPLKVELTPLRKVGSQSIPSPSPLLPENRTMLSLKKLRELEQEVQPTTEEAAQGEGIGVGVSVDFFNLFLDCVKGEGGAKGAFTSAGPTILVLAKMEDDDYARAIQVICREVYREKTKEELQGTPVITKAKCSDLEQLDPKYKVSLIESNDASSLPPSFLEEFARADKPGFLIFYVDEAKSEEFYDTIKWDKLYPQRVHLYLLNFKKLSLDMNKRLASLAWGLGETTNWFSDIIDSGVRPDSFDCFFLSGDAKFWKYLESLKNMESGLYSMATKPNIEGEEGGKESGLHYSLKLFLVHHYAKKGNLRDLGKILEEIRTEENLDGGRADLYLPAEKIAIEVETLYGQGFSPLAPIYEKVRNRVLEHRQRVHFILSNLTLLRHFNGLKGIKRNLGNFSDLVEFYGIDIKRGTLLPLKEIESEIHQIAESI